ncbi:hypothetical protein [Paracoccus sp. PAR01]|uniref:hypothetical protein n=1 Tax=Paracoccus sp. PAR01 TaxID=2769282 RepID=UPI0017821FF4|nr:hypothetical protein [Paracoccus sp. PAR01]MBD9528991.1 hypothetical protein [Paracoccus sp. PAR01]
MTLQLFGKTLSLHWKTCWIRGSHGAWIIRFPWNRMALFSERTGAWKHRRFMGFRWGWRP